MPVSTCALGEGLCLGIFYHLAESRESAIREITPFYEEHVKMFGPLGFVPGHDAGAARGDHAARRLGRRRRPDASSTTRKVGAWFAGPPEELVAYLKSLEAALSPASSTST